MLYHTLRLCQIAEIQVSVLRRILKAKAVPFLAIKTDLGAEDMGQLRTRIEAFVEML